VTVHRRTMPAGAGREACTSDRGQDACGFARRTRRSPRSPSKLLPHVRNSRDDGHGGHRGLRVPADHGLESCYPDAQARWSARCAGLVYLTQKDKYEAIIEDIEDCVKRQQRCWWARLVETSELLSGSSKARHPRTRLNAKQHERERTSSAGRPGRAVTIARTWPAADGHLSGNLKAELAELTRPTAPRGAVEPTGRSATATWWRRAACHRRHERHESRASTTSCAALGPPGGPGSSASTSLSKTNLMRIFREPRPHQALATNRGMKESEVIEKQDALAPDRARQRKVEAYNFGPAQDLLEYDDVATTRQGIYQRAPADGGGRTSPTPVTGIRAEV